MAWSFPIARIFGTQLRVHVSFFFAVAGFAVWGYREAGTPGAIFGALFTLSLFTCVVLHEFGHAFAGRLFGIRTPDITLLPIGGLARLERMPRNPWHEFVIAVAGPAVNVGIAAVIGMFLWLKQDFAQMPTSFPPLNLPQLITYLLTVNIVLVVFNMIPAFPMDGGRVLRSLLAAVLPHARATAIAAGLGQTIAVFGGIWAFTALDFPYLLILIAIFIFFAAGREASASRLRAATEGLLVSAAMRRYFTCFRPEHTLGQAADTLVSAPQSNFPVSDERGAFVGVLSHSGILRGLRKHGPEAPVSLVMGPPTRPVLSSENLEIALELLSAKSTPFVPIVEVPNGPLAGIITAQSVGDMLSVRSASSGRV